MTKNQITAIGQAVKLAGSFPGHNQNIHLKDSAPASAASHYAAPRPVQALQTYDIGGPRLPLSYPLLTILALFPPIFRRVMDPALEKHQASVAARRRAKTDACDAAKLQ